MRGCRRKGATRLTFLRKSGSNASNVDGEGGIFTITVVVRYRK